MRHAWLTWPRPPLAAQPREPVAAKAATQRVSFSGSQARAIWGARLDRLGRAAIAVELEMVRRRRIPATLIWVSYAGVAAIAERVQSLGLVVAPVKAALGHTADWLAEDSNAEPMALLDYALLIGTSPLDAPALALAARDGARQRCSVIRSVARAPGRTTCGAGKAIRSPACSCAGATGSELPCCARIAGSGTGAARALFGGLCRHAGSFTRVYRSGPRHGARRGGAVARRNGRLDNRRIGGERGGRSQDGCVPLHLAVG